MGRPVSLSHLRSARGGEGCLAQTVGSCLALGVSPETSTEGCGVWPLPWLSCSSTQGEFRATLKNPGRARATLGPVTSGYTYDEAAREPACCSPNGASSPWYLLGWGCSQSHASCHVTPGPGHLVHTSESVSLKSSLPPFQNQHHCPQWYS